ncbi:hypothetical protein [Streptomyces sp. NPDC001020]
MLGSLLTTRIGHYARETINQLTPQHQATAAKASGGGERPDVDKLDGTSLRWQRSLNFRGLDSLEIAFTAAARSSKG